jgi:rhodanese-related sulfurtransferase
LSDPSHGTRFLEIVNDAKSRIHQNDVISVKGLLDEGRVFHLVDVREESEWSAGHLPAAIHLGKGIIERDIEKMIPDLDAEIVLYCGGGYRSALAAHSLQQMGYTNVWSMDGGIRAWCEVAYPVVLD